ncbi:MAG: hypothetical protein AB7S73_16610, partial [Aquabacterium sp.]
VHALQGRMGMWTSRSATCPHAHTALRPPPIVAVGFHTKRRGADAARQRIDALQAAQQAALEVASSWDRQFLAGKKNWQDVMNAARETTQTEVQLADAQSTAVVTSWRLAVLTQGLNWISKDMADASAHGAAR